MSEANTTPAASGAVASNMTAAPNASNLVQPAAKKKVKIKALRAICVNNLTLAPGAIAEVDEDVAAEYCDTKFEGSYSFAGERSLATSERFQVVRAERISA